MKNNFVDLPVPVASAGCKNVYEPLQWAKKNCPSYITNDVCRDTNCYRFYFSDEKDYILTVLRWT